MEHSYHLAYQVSFSSNHSGTMYTRVYFYRQFSNSLHCMCSIYLYISFNIISYIMTIGIDSYFYILLMFGDHHLISGYINEDCSNIWYIFNLMSFSIVYISIHFNYYYQFIVTPHLLRKCTVANIHIKTVYNTPHFY